MFLEKMLSSTISYTCAILRPGQTVLSIEVLFCFVIPLPRTDPLFKHYSPPQCKILVIINTAPHLVRDRTPTFKPCLSCSFEKIAFHINTNVPQMSSKEGQLGVCFSEFLHKILRIQLQCTSGFSPCLLLTCFYGFNVILDSLETGYHSIALAALDLTGWL